MVKVQSKKSQAERENKQANKNSWLY